MKKPTLLALAAVAVAVFLPACASDDPVVHSTTTTESTAVRPMHSSTSVESTTVRQ